MSNQAAVTVDSLVKFTNLKKKFSFANKSKQENLDESVSSVSVTTNSDAEDVDEEVNNTSKSHWKGSARLKKEDSSGSSSESEKISKKKKNKCKLDSSNDFNENKKRKSIVINKTDDEIPNEPLKKKARKIILDSEDEDESASKQETVKSSSSSAKTSTSSLKSAKESPPSKQEKSNKKKLVIKSSSEDENDEDEKESRAKKEENKREKKKEKKKDKKKKSKKNKFKSDDENNYEDQDDSDFDRVGASGDSEDSDQDGENISEEHQAAILSLLNDSPLADIQSMINISTKKLETILTLRPFENFKDLTNKLSQKSLINIIYSAKDIIYARSIVGNLLARCEKISRNMEQQVARLIEGNDDTDSSSSLEIKSQPKILNKNLSLKPYQLIGLNWLCLMHKEKINAILADEMGLGKTCQTISFLAHLLETNRKLMHLIIVPPSTLDNWIREISTWCPDFNFTVYQGNLEERRSLRYDILNNRFEKPLNAILTTYGLISSTNEDKAFFKKLKVEYCVFDEAHMLKNMNSIRYQSLIKIQSKRKLLLTGTPLQNNLVELMSLLYFTMPDVFQNRTQYVNKIFSARPSNIDVDTFYNEKIAQAKGIMRPFILRRLKTEVLKQLPQKIEEIIYCDMSTRQEKEYANLKSYYMKRKDELEKEQAEKAEKEKQKEVKPVAKMDEIYDLMSTSSSTSKAKKNAENKKKENETNSTNIFMELRKAANHPLLRRVIYDDEKLKEMAKLVTKFSPPDTRYEYVLEDMSIMSDFQLHKLCFLYKCLQGFELKERDILHSGKFTVLDALLQEKKESGDRVLIFSQFVIMLDILEEFLKIKQYKYFRLDGQTAVGERQDMIDSYNNDKEIFVFLLSTKAGGVGINLTAANVVVLHDIDFNPFNDKQAEDRCHRVGQTKEVQVYKLISKNSIDETMLKIQKKKLELGAEISGENEETQSKADMVYLLQEALKV